MSRWLKEPLLHFLLIGVGLFALFYQVTDPQAVADDRIQITEADIDRVIAMFERKWQRPPSPDEVNGLIEARIREEVLYREALAMGLDEDDTVVRRRMAQKMDFLFNDLAEVSEPTEEALQAFYEANPDRFSASGQTSFDHVYLSADQRGGDAKIQARNLLRVLDADPESVDPVMIGDRFVLGYNFDRQSDRQVTNMFGQEFATALATLEPGMWRGPVGSSYELHLVYVRARIRGRLPPLAEVRQAVLREFQAKKRREADQAFYRALRERYTVVVERSEREPERLASTVERK